MKNRFCTCLIIISIFLFGFVACKSEVQEKTPQEKLMEVKINVSFPSFEEVLFADNIKKSSRAAYLQNDEIVSQYLYTLKGKLKGTEEYIDLFTQREYANLNEPFTLKTGEWFFILEASRIEGEGESAKEIVYLKGYSPEESDDSEDGLIIQEGTSSTLGFKMEYTEGAEGNYTVSMKIPEDPYQTGEQTMYHRIKILDYKNPSVTLYEYKGPVTIEPDDPDNPTNPDEPIEAEESRVTQKIYENEDYERFCDYYITLPIGRYIIFIYSPQEIDSTTSTKIIAQDFINIYGGLTYGKTYPYSDSEVLPDVDVELYVGTGYEEQFEDGIQARQGPDFNYDCDYKYDSEKGCLVYDNVNPTNDLLLPKIILEDKYLTGWYNDVNYSDPADYSLYVVCKNSAYSLSEASYIKYDLSKAVGKIKLYAKYAPKYSVEVETGVSDTEIDDISIMYKDEVVKAPESGSLYTVDGCYFEFFPRDIKVTKEGSYFYGWYSDADLTEPVNKDYKYNDDYSGKDSSGNTIKLYTRFIEYQEKDVKFWDGTAEITEVCDTANNNEIIDLSEYDNYTNKITFDGQFTSDNNLWESAYISEDVIPVKEGYSFEGWYADPEFNTPLRRNSGKTYYDYIYVRYLTIDDFLEDDTINIYAKFKELAQSSMEVQVQKYTQNGLALSYEIDGGNLIVTAEKLDSNKEYSKYRWYVNGEKQAEEDELFEYSLYYVDQDDNLVFEYTEPSMFISCIAIMGNEDDADSDDASLDLLFNVSADLSITFNNDNTNDLFMLSSGIFSNSEGNDVWCQYTVKTKAGESINASDYDFLWYVNGVLVTDWYYNYENKSATQAADDEQYKERIILLKNGAVGKYLVTCVIIDKETLQTYDASYRENKTY